MRGAPSADDGIERNTLAGGARQNNRKKALDIPLPTMQIK